MKFKSRRTGHIYQNIRVAMAANCDGNCDGCCINERVRDYVASTNPCLDYCLDNPVEAADLMGYELVDDHLPDTTKKVEIQRNSMTAEKYINHVFRRDEIFCQTAEESVELAQACDDLRRASMKLSKAVLKLRRAEHGTTPVSLTEATRAVLEECADVVVCIRALEAMGVFNREELDNVVREKLERWESRALEYEKRSGGNDSCC